MKRLIIYGKIQGSNPDLPTLNKASYTTAVSQNGRAVNKIQTPAHEKHLQCVCLNSMLVLISSQ